MVSVEVVIDFIFKTRKSQEEMSTFEIMQNLHYFFTNILKDADVREDFDTESINKSIQWAVYCEKVYESCQGRDLEKQVDEELKKLFSLDTTWRGEVIDINCVKNAVSLLQKALLQNPYLSDSAFDSVMKSYHNESNLIDDCATLAKRKMQSQLYTHILEGILSCENAEIFDKS